MASPVAAATTEGSVNTAGTSHAVTLPAGGSASDEYIIVLSKGTPATTATFNALTDWTELLDENVSLGLAAWVYDGAGVPSNPTFTSSLSIRSAWIVYRITGADKGTTPQIGTTATGTSATPDPPASATPPSSKDYLFIAFAGMAGEEADDDTWANTPPTNYLPNPPLQKACGTAGTNLAGLVMAASRQLTTGSAENPGSFGVDVSAAWRAQTITVHPTTAVDHSQPVDDSASVTDAANRAVGKVAADAATVTDQAATAAAYVRAQDDAAALTDQASTVTAYVRTIEDGLSLADSATPESGGGAVDHELPLDDSIAATDQVGLSYALHLNDAVAISDQIDRDWTAVRTVDDAAAATDQAGVAWQASRALDDAAALTDAAAPTWAAQRTIADEAQATDLAARSWAAVRTVTDSAQLADSSQRDFSGGGVGHELELNDTLEATDATTPASGFSLSVEDAAGLTDTAASGVGVGLADLLAGADELARSAVFVRSVSDNLTLADAFDSGDVEWSYGPSPGWSYGALTGATYAAADDWTYGEEDFRADSD